MSEDNRRRLIKLPLIRINMWVANAFRPSVIKQVNQIIIAIYISILNKVLKGWSIHIHAEKYSALEVYSWSWWIGIIESAKYVAYVVLIDLAIIHALVVGVELQFVRRLQKVMLFENTFKAIQFDYETAHQPYPKKIYKKIYKLAYKLHY